TVETPLYTPGSWFVRVKSGVQLALTLLFDSPTFDSQTGLAFTVFCMSREPEPRVEFAFVVWAVNPAKVAAPPKYATTPISSMRTRIAFVVLKRFRATGAEATAAMLGRLNAIAIAATTPAAAVIATPAMRSRSAPLCTAPLAATEVSVETAPRTPRPRRRVMLLRSRDLRVCAAAGAVWRSASTAGSSIVSGSTAAWGAEPRDAPAPIDDAPSLSVWNLVIV